MCFELIEYIIVDENTKDKKAARDIHIYYKLIDKPLKDKSNALAYARTYTQDDRLILKSYFVGSK